MYDKWTRAASSGNVTGVVLVDLSSAFDLVPAELLIRKLKVYGIKEDITTWIASYLTGRHQTVWIDHLFSECLKTSTGVPQGSILGPLFFLIYFNDLPVFMKENIECYADDSTVSAVGANSADISSLLTSDCKSLSNWMTGNKFKLNAEKTHLMLLGSSARLQNMQEPTVSINGVSLKQSIEKRNLY